MLHIITSNPLDVKSIKQYNDNFVICHTTAKPVILSRNGDIQYKFNIYHQDGMDVTEADEYETNPGYEYNFIPSVDLTTVFKAIARDIEEIENDLRKRAEDMDMTPDEIMLASVCDIRWNRKAVSYFNARLNERHVHTNCLDLYQYYRITKTERLVQILKNRLNSEFIYPEDPIQFGYALHRMLGSVMS